MNTVTIILLSIGGLLGVLILLLIFGSANISISSHGNLKVVLSVAGIRKTLVHEDKEEEKLFQCNHPRLALWRERRRQKKREKKALKKERKKALKKAKRELAKESGSFTPSLLDRLQIILTLVKTVYKKTKGKITVNISQMELHIGTSNAATTAILYGVVVQTVSYLLNFIDKHFAEIIKNQEATFVTPDYSSYSSSADIEIDFTVKLRKALAIAIGIVLAYQKESTAAEERFEERKPQDNNASRLSD